MSATSETSSKDQIRWVESRLRERIAFEQGQFPEWRQLQSAQSRENLEIWLAKERDGRSWQQIVIKHFPEYLRPGGLGKTAGMSKARRVYNAVQRELNPTDEEVLRDWLDSKIEELFGVRPEVFKKYVHNIRSDRPAKKPTKKRVRKV